MRAPTVDRLLTFELTLPNSRYSDNARVTAFFDDALARIRGLPGVQRAGAISMLPLVNWGNNSDFTIEGRTWPDGRSPLLETRVVRGDYFQTMGIRLVRGRLFTERDNVTAPKVVIINETVAQRFFAGEDPVGKRLTFYGSGGPLSEIVGVVASVRSAELSRPPLIEAYAPDLQYPNNSLTFVVRTTAEPTAPWHTPALASSTAATSSRSLAGCTSRPIRTSCATGPGGTSKS